jgi:drug/metabolite transporter (DMT)-like permease
MGGFFVFNKNNQKERIMNGIILSLITAVFASLHDSCINKSSKEGNPYITALAINIFCIPIVLSVLIFTGIPETNIYFWLAVFIKIPLMSLSDLLRAKAHQKSEQSLIIPMLCFTPVFVMLLAPFFLNQPIRLLGALGITLLVIGAYFLNISKYKKGFWEPIKALYGDIGARYMLLVAFIWGITAMLDGIGVTNAGSSKVNIFLSLKAGIYWLICTQILSSILIGIIIFFRRKKIILKKEKINLLLSIGITNGILSIAQMCAMGLIPAAYVNSIKRLSIIFSIVTGHFHFKEEGLKERMIGATIMIFGFILITLSK